MREAVYETVIIKWILRCGKRKWKEERYMVVERNRAVFTEAPTAVPDGKCGCFRGRTMENLAECGDED